MLQFKWGRDSVTKWDMGRGPGVLAEMSRDIFQKFWFFQKKLKFPRPTTKALRNWKIFVDAYQNNYTILAKLMKRLIAIIIASFVIMKINET